MITQLYGSAILHFWACNDLKIVEKLLIFLIEGNNMNRNTSAKSFVEKIYKNDLKKINPIPEKSAVSTKNHRTINI